MSLGSLLSIWVLGSALLLGQGLSAKKFDVEKGTVLFEIKGGGKLSDDVRIHTLGEGTLRFKDWGEVAVLEEQYKEVTSGALQHINRVSLYEKFEGRQHYEVDYQTEKIFVRPMPKGHFRDYYVKGLTKHGTETIAGRVCDVWEAEGVKKCLYKGIPLLIEHYILGVYYEKRATAFKEGEVSDPEAFSLPEYPVEKFALLTRGNIKTKSVKLPEELSQRIAMVSKEVQASLKKSHRTMDDLTEVERREIFDRLGEKAFENQKRFLPEFLAVLKQSRLCLQQADDVAQANVCILDVVRMKKQVSENVTEKITSWDEKNRSRILEDVDDTITLLASKMKCIRASQNLHDLSNCMKSVQ